MRPNKDWVDNSENQQRPLIHPNNYGSYGDTATGMSSQ